MTFSRPDQPLPPETVYRNARLVDPASGLDAPGGLLTNGEHIAALGPGMFQDECPAGTEVVDCGGAVLAPGLIDTRAHLGEPGAEHKETIATASASAAAGGITSLVCTPDTDPVIDQVAVVEFISRRARETSLVHVYASAAITVGRAGQSLTEMGRLAESGAVAFTDADRALANPRLMLHALRYAHSLDLLLIQHPLDPDLAGEGVMNSGSLATRLGLPGIPTVAETALVQRDLLLAEAADSRIHFTNLSTAASIDAVRQAKARGIAVTAATAPHYLALDETEVVGWRTHAKVSPPLRSHADREAVAEAVSDGTVDIVASDHTPQDEDSKRLPFEQAAYGMASLETVLPLLLEQVHAGTMTLLDMLAPVTVRPAELFGLPGGRLAPGRPADLVLFDPDDRRLLKADSFISKSKNAPYTGRPVRGRVLRTVVNGRAVMVDPPLAA